jgi:hypothetical protein
MWCSPNIDFIGLVNALPLKMAALRALVSKFLKNAE